MNEMNEHYDKSHLSGPLQYSYDCFTDMSQRSLIFGYRGLVTADLVTHVLQIMAERLEEEKSSKKVSKKVFNVMIECLRNVYSDETGTIGASFMDPNAILLVRKDGDAYYVSTGNYIMNVSVSELKERIDKVNGLEGEALKSYYQELLESSDPSERGLTGLGMIDIARKSKQKLVYNFQPLNETFSFFTLEAKIDKNVL